MSRIGRQPIPIPSGVTVHPSLAWWHDSQLRPFAPRLLKNGLEKSMVPVVL